jgi:hypothetical protein
MDNKGKPKSLIINDKINTLEQVDVHIGAHIEKAEVEAISAHATTYCEQS